MRIVVFDAKPYDIEFFEKWNKNNIFQRKTYVKQRHVNKISGCSLHIRK